MIPGVRDDEPEEFRKPRVSGDDPREADFEVAVYK